MKRYKQLATAGVALSIVGVLAGCGTGNSSTPMTNNSGSSNVALSPANNTSQQTSDTNTSINNTSKPTTDTNSTNTSQNQDSGQKSGTQSATAGYYKGLKKVTYSSTEVQKIKQTSQQQGITASVPDKMGGPSGYYVPGRVQKGSNHSMSLNFEDMTFYEAPSWQAIKHSLTPQSGSISILNGGSYTLSGKEQGQWYTLKYSDGARSDIFVVQEGNTWVGIVPNPAKYTIPSLVQAVAETLKPIS